MGAGAGTIVVEPPKPDQASADSGSLPGRPGVRAPEYREARAGRRQQVEPGRRTPDMYGHDCSAAHQPGPQAVRADPLEHRGQACRFVPPVNKGLRRYRLITRKVPSTATGKVAGEAAEPMETTMDRYPLARDYPSDC